MKKWVILEELQIWLRGRFTLTEEEKIWLLLILFICWVGLVGRSIHLKNQQPERLSPQDVSTLLTKDK